MHLVINTQFQSLLCLPSNNLGVGHCSCMHRKVRVLAVCSNLKCGMPYIVRLLWLDVDLVATYTCRNACILTMYGASLNKFLVTHRNCTFKLVASF